jgi:uncharacterized membrane protein
MAGWQSEMCQCVLETACADVRYVGLHLASVVLRFGVMIDLHRIARTGASASSTATDNDGDACRTILHRRFSSSVTVSSLVVLWHTCCVSP